MTIPFENHLRAPIIAAPMFLVSCPDLVVETCRSGLIGSFPALNQRTSEGYSDWLSEIRDRLSGMGRADAPFAVNLVVHRSNTRLEADLAITAAQRVPIVITSLGIVPEVIETVHSYGGLVFHDVINLRHARKAAESGVDGIIAVCSGAGGHAGELSAFAFLSELRAMFDGTIILGGVMSNGAQVAAARLLGADFAYMGTRFIATQESLAPAGHKAMVVEARADDIIYTPAVSGVHGNFLRPSFVAAGLDPDTMTAPGKLNLGTGSEIKAWKTILSAGQGVGGVGDVLPAAELCDRLVAEYNHALESAPGLRLGA